MFERGHSLFHWEVVDVVVKRRDVKEVDRSLRSNVAFFYFDAVLKAPDAKVSARLRRDFWLKLHAEGGERRIR